MDISEQKWYTYFNWTLTWQVNQVFEQFINCEVTRPSYAKKKRRSHYALNKRKWYKKLSVGLWLEDWSVTDIKVIPWSSCWGTENKTYLYLLSPDKTQFQIWNRPNQCEFEATQVLAWDACACWYNKFTPVEYAIGTPKIMSSSSFADWVQSDVIALNYNFWTPWVPVQWRLWITGEIAFDYWTWATQVSLWDYVVIRTGRASWQSKRIIGYDDTRKELILDTPWSWFETGTLSYSWHTASVYPKWGTTLLFADANGPIVLNVWVSSATYTIQTIALNIIEDRCISDITVSSGIWNFLTSEWYVVFGNAWLDAAYFAGSELIWEQFNQVISFRGYNVFTSKRSIKAWVVTAVDNWYMQSLYNLASDVGMWSKDAYTQFKNSLYVLGSNKRLYAASIANWSSSSVDPKLELTNMSEAIIGELDLLTDDDSVTLYADEKTLKLFISSGGKTKILIYESDYWLWHTHRILNWEIHSYSEWFYLWDWLYQYCGDKDGPLTSWQFFTQEISALIGENEPNGMSFNSFQEKKMDFIKLNIWPSILNEWSSKVLVEVNRRETKSTVEFDQWNQISWVNKYNDIFAWWLPTPETCVTYSLTWCEKVENEFEWSTNKDETFGWQSTLLRDDLCQCPNEFMEQSDMVDGYDSKAYFLSDAYNVFVSTQELIQASIFRVRFIAGRWDRMRFNWFFSWVIPNAIEDNNGDNADTLLSDCSIC